MRAPTVGPYDSSALIQAIKMSSSLKGGADKLAETVARSLALVLPGQFQEAFLDHVMMPGDEVKPVKLNADTEKLVPSSSLVRRYELALEFAIMILTRKMKEKNPDGEKFQLHDSSPYADFEWLWSMYIELASEDIIPTFEAVNEMRRRVSEYVKRINKTKKDDEAWTTEELTYVPEEWKPLLHQIKRSIVPHINHPAALASGNMGLADKVATEVYKQHFNCPPSVNLGEDATRVRSNTGDMGHEMAIPTFKVDSDKVENLLPAWVQRRDLGDDISRASELEELGEPCNDDDLGDDLQVDEDDDLGCDIDEGDLECGICLDDGVHPAGPRPEPSQDQRPPVPEAPKGKEYMPNSLTISGLMHQMDNQNNDSNKAMDYWPQFWMELKNLEAMLRSSDRRQSCVVTCIRPSRFAFLEKRILKFDASLYEDRWLEVINFLKKVRPLLSGLTQTFKAARFRSKATEADVNDNTSRRKAKARSRNDTAKQLSEFDPELLEKSLSTGLFHYFINMVFLLDSIPADFAKRYALCPCHGELLKGLDGYKMRLVLEAHYGQGISSCPMGAKTLPELLSNGVRQVMDELRDLAEVSIRTYDPPPGVSEMSEQHWDILLRNFRQGYRANLAIAEMKNAYLVSLPICLGGVAVENEDEARANGRRAREAFRKDPREEVHDPRTFRLMGDGSIFSCDLDKFIDGGIARKDLRYEFRYEIALFRYPFVLETTVEERHAKASVTARKHWVGPVKLSLSNRLPMMELWIQLGVITGLDLLDAFSAARSLLDIPHLFGLDLHTNLGPVDAQGKKTHPASLRADLCNVLYRCDLADMFGLLKYSQNSCRV